MNRSELIKEIVSRSGSRRNDVQKHMELFEEIVLETISDGEGVHMREFLSIMVEERAARNKYNPQKHDGSMVFVPAHKVAKIRAGIKLRVAANNG